MSIGFVAHEARDVDSLEVLTGLEVGLGSCAYGPGKLRPAGSALKRRADQSGRQDEEPARQRARRQSVKDLYVGSS
jgi:hypothetical protein